MSEAKERTRLTLEKRHQLIDLNKEYVNFDIAFECRAVDATKDFEIIVATQEQLNTIDLTNLTMKRTKGGYISGNIIADEDKYQNYFLIVRSATDEPIEVDLDIRIKPIEPRPQQQPPQPTSTEVPMPPPPFEMSIANDDLVCGGVDKKNNKLIWLVIVVVIVAAAAGGYYYYTKRNDKCGLVVVAADDAASVASASSHHSSSSSDESGLLESLIQKSKSKK